MRFEVRRDYLDRYLPQEAGGRELQEHRIPAGDIGAFNQAIVGSIEVTREFP